MKKVKFPKHADINQMAYAIVQAATDESEPINGGENYDKKRISPRWSTDRRLRGRKPQDPKSLILARKDFGSWRSL